LQIFSQIVLVKEYLKSVHIWQKCEQKFDGTFSMAAAAIGYTTNSSQ